MCWKDRLFGIFMYGGACVWSGLTVKAIADDTYRQDGNYDNTVKTAMFTPIVYYTSPIWVPFWITGRAIGKCMILNDKRRKI